jgi:PBSX family phage terminase large subunit
MKKVKIECLSHQADFINSDTRFTLNSGGVGSGKTYSLVLKALQNIQRYPGVFGLIGAQTYPLLRDTTLREFINIIPPEIIKTYNKTEQHFKFKNGSEIIFRAFDDPNKLKSLNLGFAAVEEMTDISEEIFKMLRTRLRQKGMPGELFGATNPGTFGNWVYKYFIEKPIKNSSIIYSISADNDFLPEDYLEDLREIKVSNPEYYERMVMGKWGALEGLIYNLPMAQRISEGIPSINKFHRIIAGLDFGFTHPNAFTICGIREDKYYVIEEDYQRGLTSGDIIKMVKEKMLTYDIECIYYDPARPEIAEDLARDGIPIKAAIKDVFDGIMHIKSLIGAERFFVSKECTYTLREFDSYIWDAKNIVKEVPIKVNDDCFVGETRIQTLRGNIKIENVKKTDLILTRNGYREILLFHKKKKKVQKFKYNDKSIICTKDHPFYSVNKNKFIPVCDLTDKDTLFILDKKEALKCQKMKLLFIKELNLEGGLNQNIKIIEAIIPAIAIILKKGLELYIDIFGNARKGKFQKIIKYIIKMAIRLIIQLRIWNVCLLGFIYQNILKNGVENIKNKSKFILIQFAQNLLNGISPKKVGNGTRSIANKLLQKWVTSIFDAKFVEMLIKQKKIKEINLNFVQINVNLNIDGEIRLITLLSSVKNVEKNFKVINIENQIIVQEVVPVRHVGKEKNKTVYNLTVKDKHEYFANNILVHNCMDAIRYMLYTDFKHGSSSDFSSSGDRETAEHP